jgi:peroxiredoxin
VYDRYKARDVEILAIHVDDTEPDVRAFLEAHRATYPTALDPSLRVANRFGFKRAPYTVVVNKRGEIAARLDATADEARLRAAIDAALRPPPRRGAPARAS